MFEVLDSVWSVRVIRIFVRLAIKIGDPAPGMYGILIAFGKASQLFCTKCLNIVAFDDLSFFECSISAAIPRPLGRVPQPKV